MTSHRGGYGKEVKSPKQAGAKSGVGRLQKAKRGVGKVKKAPR